MATLLFMSSSHITFCKMKASRYYSPYRETVNTYYIEYYPGTHVFILITVNAISQLNRVLNIYNEKRDLFLRFQFNRLKRKYFRKNQKWREKMFKNLSIYVFFWVHCIEVFEIITTNAYVYVYTSNDLLRVAWKRDKGA